MMFLNCTEILREYKYQNDSFFRRLIKRNNSNTNAAILQHICSISNSQAAVLQRNCNIANFHVTMFSIKPIFIDVFKYTDNLRKQGYQNDFLFQRLINRNKSNINAAAYLQFRKLSCSINVIYLQYCKIHAVMLHIGTVANFEAAILQHICNMVIFYSLIV